MINGTIKKLILISPHDSSLAYGLRLVSSYLKAHEIDTTLVFLPTYTEIWQQFFSQKFAPYNKKILRQVCDIASDSDAIGISMMTMEKGRVESLCRVLKELDKPILLGGIHPTIDPEDAIDISGLINIGEGFDSLVEFCKNSSKRDMKNIWFKDEDGIVVRNEIRPALENIDAIPFPDYDYKNHFILWGGKVTRVDRGVQERIIGPIYHQFASIGCPFSCTYCVNNKYKKLGLSYQKFRFHSVDYILNEIKYGLSVSSRIEYINFPDDGFIALNEKTIEEFAERYRREIGLPFSIMGIIPEYLSKRKMDLLVNAGLKRVRVGLQSANSDSLRLYKRTATFIKYVEVNDILQSYHSIVFPYYDIIIDNLFVDSEKDALDTIKFLLGLKGKFTLFLFSLRLYPGTDLYEKSLSLKVPERYYQDSYVDYNNTILNYILTIIQCSQSRFTVSFALKIYQRSGNIKIPKFLFFINMLLWMARCAFEHIRKHDISGLPVILARYFSKKWKKVNSFAGWSLNPREALPKND